MEIEPSDLLERIAAHSAPVILDVRSTREYAAGHVPGAVHVPFWSALFVPARRIAQRDRPIVVYCGHGPRARLAGAALRMRGFRNLRFLCGHMARWRRSGLPVER